MMITPLTMRIKARPSWRASLIALLWMIAVLRPTTGQATDFDLHQVGFYGGWSASTVASSGDLITAGDENILRVIDASNLRALR